MIRGPPGATRRDTLVRYTTVCRSGNDINVRAITYQEPPHVQPQHRAQRRPLCLSAGELPARERAAAAAARGDRGAAGCRHADRARAGPVHGAAGRADRSEEHTSELQSLMRISYAVFCLKKKKHK